MQLLSVVNPPSLSRYIAAQATTCSGNKIAKPCAAPEHPAEDASPPIAPMILLAALAMLSTAAMDMVVPLVDTLKLSLVGGHAHAGLVISMFPAGSAVAQIFCGPLSDRLGRRRLLIAGCALYVVATLGCALATSFSALAGFRFLVGSGGGACLAITFAVVRDTTTGRSTSMAVSKITAAMWAFSIVGAPLASLTLGTLGWRAVFFVLALASSALLTVLALRLPETLAVSRRTRPSLSRLLVDYRMVARSQCVRGNAVMGAMAFSVLLSMGVGAGSLLKVAPGTMGVWYGVVVAGLSAGSVLGNALLQRDTRRHSLQGAGAVLMLLASLSLLLASIASPTRDLPPALATLLMTVSTLGVGIVTPCTIAGAVAAFPERSATAACLVGIVRMATAAAISAGVVFLGATDPVVVAVVMSVCAAIGLVAWAKIKDEAARPVSPADEVPEFGAGPVSAAPAPLIKSL